MKYISVLIVVGLMVWTWSLATANRGVSLETQKGLEADVEQIIRTQILQKDASVTDIIFRQLYTEVIKPREQVRAHYRYVIKAPTQAGDATNEMREGSALLTSTDGGQTWMISDVENKGASVEFQNGSRVSPKDTNEPTEGETHQ